MLDVWSATVIAGLGDGLVVHWKPDCVGRDDWELASNTYDGTVRGFHERIEELTDLEPLIRYNIHEWESANFSDAVYSGDLDEEHDFDSDSPYVWVLCDACGERIE